MPDLRPVVRLVDLQRTIGGQLLGDPETPIRGASSLELADSEQLSFVSSDRHVSAARASHAAAFVVAKPIPELTRPQIVVPNPAYAFARLVRAHFIQAPQRRGISADLIKGNDVSLGEEVTIGPHVALGDRVTIGARTTLFPGVYLGDDVTVGSDCVLYPHVAVLERCTLGDRVIVHAGTVIGSDGFGYVQHEGRHEKIPQLGTVEIENDVELGANVTIDRATFGRTLIQRGTKIDNLVQVAHNVTVGEHCILVAQVGIAGSTTLGHHVVVGGQSGLGDHLKVGNGAMLAARSGVMRDIPDGQVVSGTPALPHEQTTRLFYVTLKLPEIREQLHTLEARVKALESAPAQSQAPKNRRRRTRK